MPQGVGWRSQIGFFNGHLLWSPLFFFAVTLNSFFHLNLFLYFYGKPLKMNQKICDFCVFRLLLVLGGQPHLVHFLWKDSLDSFKKNQLLQLSQPNTQLNSSVGKYQYVISGSIHIWRHMFWGYFWPTYLLKYRNQILYYISQFSKIRFSLTYQYLPT